MNDRASKAAVLAVGTEITDGQISDRNSQWLSSRLVGMGFEIDQHRAVPDDREKIITALSEFSGRAAWVFVTGGLGPTSDDFTRECVAEVLEATLEWHEPSWKDITDRLTARGAVATENQKQQCFFPKKSHILKNTRGTAHGFIGVSKSGARIVSLPGPPLEIEAIWRDGLQAEIEKYVFETTAQGNFRPARRLTIVRTMGLGEGALAHGVEALIDRAMVKRAAEGLPSLGRPELGYRAHAPYVEVKIWALATQENWVEQLSEEICREFKDYVVNRNDEDAADLFLEKILVDDRKGIKIRIFDSITRGAILQRLHERAAQLNRSELTEAIDRSVLVTVSLAPATPASPAETSIQVREYGLSVGKDELTLEIEMPDEVSTVNLPKLAQSLRSDRGRKWAIEFALLEWGNA